MNPSSDLQALMALDALGDATPEQQAELKQRLAASPDLVLQRAAMRALVGRMDDAAGPVSSPVAVPAQALARIEEARTRSLARATAAQARVQGAANVVALSDATPSSNAVQASARKMVPRSRNLMQMLAWAAVIALLAVPVGWWLSHPPGAALATASPALAPRGETGMTQPTLVWENAPSQDYDVWILPADADQKSTPPIFAASKVRSPLPFASLQPGPANADKSAALKPGTRYLALVCLAGQGRMAGVTVPFQTAPASLGAPPSLSDKATALALIQQLEAAGRPGDALMVIAGLPQATRTSAEITTIEARLRTTLQSLPR